eukprot:scaffold116775_cov63-Phaeocystis_antarctica.AAC.4
MSLPGRSPAYVETTDAPLSSGTACAAAATSASRTEAVVGLGGVARSLTGSAVGPQATTPWTERQT